MPTGGRHGKRGQQTRQFFYTAPDGYTVSGLIDSDDYVKIHLVKLAKLRRLSPRGVEIDYAAAPDFWAGDLPAPAPRPFDSRNNAAKHIAARYLERKRARAERD